MEAIIDQTFKNSPIYQKFFCFYPTFFSFSLSFINIFYTILTFILFCLIASSVYIFNDWLDVEEDRQHPIKKFRPLANEEVPKNTAMFFMLLLSATSLLLAYILKPLLSLILLIYFLFNLAYSLKLKHIPIVDIYIIAIGFVLRLLAGSVVINIKLSVWIIIVTFLLALFLGVAKRRDDILLTLQGKQTRKNINGYNLEFINLTMVLMAGVVIVSYILYTVSDISMQKQNSEYLFLTTFFVILGILRYMQIVFVEQNSGDPTKILIKDRFLKITILLWIISFTTIVKIF